MASLRRRRRFASHRIVAPTSELLSYHGVVALSSLRRRRRRFASHRIVAPTSELSSYHGVVALSSLRRRRCRFASHRRADFGDHGVVASSSSFRIASHRRADFGAIVVSWRR
jgi:hypothetical protein